MTKARNGDAAREPVVVFDISRFLHLRLDDPVEIRRHWDVAHFAASLQGIVNRDAPRLFLRYIPERDDFWWNLMREPGEWLDGRAVIEVESVADVVGLFRSRIAGAVAWDERVPATSNLASTTAGVEDLVCVRIDDAPDSVYAQVVEQLRIPVVRRLTAADGSPMFTGAGTIPETNLPSSGSAKNDAYRWLVEKYVKTGRCNVATHGYYIDADWLRSGFCGRAPSHTVVNHDYVIANRGIVWDLNVWEDETPVDDRGQRAGTDLETLLFLLRESNRLLAPDRMIHVAGYVPWRYKYTDCHETGWDAGGTHGAVATEWRCTEILTAFNAYLDADALDIAAFPNASFHRHYPLPEAIAQPERDIDREIEDAGLCARDGAPVAGKFFAHYCGDYDAAAWLYWMLPEVWTDGARGELPLSWAFNPNLAERFPFAMHWVRRTATAKDRFVAGDSGAGYVNPRNLSEPRPWSGLPCGIARWERHCAEWMGRFDLGVVGFVIDGHTPPMGPDAMDAYARLAPDGFVMQRGPADGLHDGVPFAIMGGDLPKDAREAARFIHARFANSEKRFLVFRSVILPASWYVEVQRELERLGGEERPVDMETLLALVRRSFDPKSADAARRRARPISRRVAPLP